MSNIVYGVRCPHCSQRLSFNRIVNEDIDVTITEDGDVLKEVQPDMQGETTTTYSGWCPDHGQVIDSMDEDSFDDFIQDLRDDGTDLDDEFNEDEDMYLPGDGSEDADEEDY